MCSACAELWEAEIDLKIWKQNNERKMEDLRKRK